MTSNPSILSTSTSRRTAMFGVAGGALVALAGSEPLSALAAASTPSVDAGPVSAFILFGMPKDPAAFEAHYLNVHVPLAQKIPAVGYEMGMVLGTLDGSPTPYYRIAILHLKDMAHLQAALTTPEAQAALGDLANFATGGATVFIVSGPATVPMTTPG